MSATTSGALKVLIESLGLGLSAYQDRAPLRPDGTPQPRPYVVIAEESPLVPGPMEDGGPGTAVETAFADLFQDYRDMTPGSPTYGNLKENRTLAAALRRGIHGQRLQSIGTAPNAAVVYMVIVTSSVRLLEEDGNAVHHSLTLDVHRQL